MSPLVAEKKARRQARARDDDDGDDHDDDGNDYGDDGDTKATARATS